MDGPRGGGGGGRKRRLDEMQTREERLREGIRRKATAKRVRFSVPQPEDGDRRSRIASAQPPRPNTRENYTDRTGARTDHIAEQPMRNQHPLRRPGALQRDSAGLVARARRELRRDKRPTMAGAMLSGDQTETSTSMRRGRPNPHRLVRDLLTELERSGQPRGAGHGQCAEVGAISNHLWTVDPGQRMSLADAQAYFERTGTATVAHQMNFRLTPACATCAYLTQRLCIHAMES